MTSCMHWLTPDEQKHLIFLLQHLLVLSARDALESEIGKQKERIDKLEKERIEHLENEKERSAKLEDIEKKIESSYMKLAKLTLNQHLWKTFIQSVFDPSHTLGQLRLWDTPWDKKFEEVQALARMPFAWCNQWVSWPSEIELGDWLQDRKQLIEKNELFVEQVKWKYQRTS